jgi:antitoxin CcdA
MKHDRIASGKRKPVNVSIDTGIVQAAREAGLNLSQASEAGLIVAIKRERERRWVEENRAAIESSNGWLEEHGLPFADLRMV